MTTEELTPEAKYVYENIVVLPELKNFIRPLSPDERRGLEQDILKNGIIDPIILWGITYLQYYHLSGKLPEGFEPDSEEYQNYCYVIIDGHNRYEIAEQNLSSSNEIKVTAFLMEFESIEAAKLFMISKQANRRNLTPAEISYFRGLEYNATKKTQGGNRRGEENSSYQNENLKTVEAVAAKHNVSPATISRDEKYYEGIEVIGKHNAQFKNDILSGKLKIDKGFLYEIAEFSKERPDNVVKQVIEQALSNLMRGVKPARAESKPTPRSTYENKIFDATSQEPAQEEENYFTFDTKNYLAARQNYENKIFDATSKAEPAQEEEEATHHEPIDLDSFFDKAAKASQNFELLYKKVQEESNFYKERMQYFAIEKDSLTSENNGLKQQIADLQKEFSLASSSERIKLINAGFTIFRTGQQGNRHLIKFIKYDCLDWKTLQIFDTKAERDRKAEELKKDEKYIFE